MALSEFEMIARYFSDIGPVTQPQIELSVGDDCALFAVPAGHCLAVSIDTMVSGVHFPAQASADDIARRALLAALSDLAAMGAKPLAFTLALTLPDSDERWLKAFSEGLAEVAEQYAIALVGGDSTRGALSVSIQVHGTLPNRRGLRRRGAEVGDAIFVTGSLGDAAAALAVIEQRLKVDKPQADYLLSRFYRPSARIVLGESLLGVASAAIDISDGLLADLGHIVTASDVAAQLHISQLPVSETLTAVLERDLACQYALNGGDDYELCFTAGPEYRQQIMEYADLFEVPITEVGRIVSGEGVSCLDGSGQPVQFNRQGYQHFS